MYRAPELVDMWSNYFIGPPLDVWALGCILYVLCYMKHPYEDGATLRIINANYSLPNDTRYTCFHDIISECILSYENFVSNIETHDCKLQEVVFK